MGPDEFLEALLGLPNLYDSQVSQDGQWVAWTWYRVGPAADVYAARTDASSPPIRLTDTAQNTLLVSWTSDSRSVIVSQDRDGDERDQLFRVDVNQPGVMHPLTEPSPHHFLRGGQLHPNGRWLVYAANWDHEASKELEPFWVYRHDLQTGELKPLARPQRGCNYIPKLNSPGTHVLYLRNDVHPAGRQVWVVDIQGTEDCEIYNAGAARKASASWFPDGRRALILAETETHQRLGVWESGGGAVRWLLDDPARNIEAAYVPHGSQQVVVIEVRQARTCASLLDPETAEEAPLPELPGNLVPLAPVGPADWVGEVYSSQQPTDLVRFSLADLASWRETRPSESTHAQPKATTGRPGSPLLGHQARAIAPWVSLTQVWERTLLSSTDLVPAQDFCWRSVDGLEVQGWLYRARGVPRGTVVYVHGGPTAHSEDRINGLIQFLSSQGFNVLDPNYRGSTGFSFAFRQAIKADGWGGREQEDIRAGIQALIAAGVAQPGKVGITGTSYGGYSTWWAITHFPMDLVSAAAPICGMTDLVVDYQTTRPDLRPFSEEMMGGSPEQAPERYHERSPIHFVDNIRGRLLIVQGLQDPNVSPENVRVVRDALERAGIPYELLAFEDEGHGISKPKNHKILYPRLAEFFGAWDQA